MICFWEPGKPLEQIELEAIYQALEYFGGNKSMAAADLGISLRTLRIKIIEYEELARFRGMCEGSLPQERKRASGTYHKLRDADEIEAITEALRDAGQCVAEAARLLGMNRTTLVMKMTKYGLRSADRRAEAAPAEVSHESLEDALEAPLAPAPAPQAS